MTLEQAIRYRKENPLSEDPVWQAFKKKWPVTPKMDSVDFPAFAVDGNLVQDHLQKKLDAFMKRERRKKP